MNRELKIVAFMFDDSQKLHNDMQLPHVRIGVKLTLSGIALKSQRDHMLVEDNLSISICVP